MTRRRSELEATVTAPAGRWGWQRCASFAVLGAALGLAALSSSRLLLRDPPVWPDEALFASPARELLEHGRLGTRVLDGLLPGAETATYYIPPTYLVALAGVFAAFGADIEVMRAFSTVTALGVLAVCYALARRIELTPAVAALAPALLCLDPVFARGARVGRMDMLALLCLLSATAIVLSPRPDRRHAIAAGVLSGLALTVHPMTAAVFATGLSALVISRERRRLLLALFLGSVAGTLPWLLYVLRDPAAFADQWHPQLVRKAATWREYGPDPWSYALDFAISQYPTSMRSYVLPAYALAFAGLTWSSIRVPASRVLLVLAVLLAWSLLRGAEMWYPLYATPFLALGLLAPLHRAEPSKRAARAVRLGAACLAALWLLLSTREVRSQLMRESRGSDYEAFSREIVSQLPHGARVLLAAIPDPYFATIPRTDLTVREFLPGGIPLPERRADAVLSETDFVVVGKFIPTAWIARTLSARGRLITTVGEPDDDCFGRIFAIEKSR